MAPSQEAENLLVLSNVKKYYPLTRGLLHRKAGDVKAVDGIDLTIRRGETLGLVGESGCGKSTLGRVILRLEEPTAGEIHFEGRNILRASPGEMQLLRRKMQIIFQDPYASLNPRRTVGRIIGEGLSIHRIGSPRERRERVEKVMEVVGLRPEAMHRYPHEFSGGQRQRIGIARALALNPEFMICDEPLSALDVSIQAQVINLLQDLQEAYRLTYLFISHDLSVVKHISDRIAVMYRGRLVELAEKGALFDTPHHPYTRALLEAVPVPVPGARRDRSQQAHAEDAAAASQTALRGCAYQPKCPDAAPACGDAVPELREVRPGHWVRCFHG